MSNGQMGARLGGTMTDRGADDGATALAEALVAGMRGLSGTAEGLRALTPALEAARSGGVARDPVALATLEAGVRGLDPILGRSALAHVTGDLRHFVDILAMVRNVMDLAPLDGINQIYWSIQRQSFLARMRPESVPDFGPRILRPFHEAFVAEIARRFAVAPSPASATATDRPIERVVMVTNQFLSPLHQPSRDILRRAAGLRRAIGRSGGTAEVTILNTNMMPDRYHSPFVPPFAAEIEAALDGDQTLTVEGETHRIISVAEPGITPGKVNRFIDTVKRLDPDVVVSVGGSVTIADLLAGARPCVCLQTTTGYTVSLAHLILDFGGSAPPTGDDPYARAWRPFRLGLSLRHDPRPMTRAELGVPDDAFVMVVMGNRLDHEVTADFLDTLDRVMDGDRRAWVVFAGAVDALPDRLAHRRHADRTRCAGWVERVHGLMSMSDVFVNPPRTGGGAGAAQALAAGVPIVTLPHGDVAGVAGPDFRVADAAGRMERLATLCADRGALDAARAAARDRHAELAAEGEDDGRLLSLLEEARSLFARR